MSGRRPRMLLLCALLLGACSREPGPVAPPALPTLGEVWGDGLATLPDWTGRWQPRDCARAPAGLPLLAADQGVLEFLVAPDQTLIVRVDTDLVRRVHTDGRTHPPVAAWPPAALGHSVGRWEADTLVIETVHLQTLLPDGAAAPTDARRRAVERIRRVASDRIEIALEMEDPAQQAGVVRRVRELVPASTDAAPDCSGRTGTIARQPDG